MTGTFGPKFWHLEFRPGYHGYPRNRQEMTRAETELQVSFVQERGRLDALLNAESDCAQQLEASRLREKYLDTWKNAANGWISS